MTSPLEKLPVELLDLIFESLDETAWNRPYIRRKSTWGALCLSSKRLRKAATPYLYREVRFNDARPKYRQLARTLCERHELTEHVHLLDAKPFLAKPDDQPTAEELALFLRQIEPLKAQAVYRMLGGALWSGCYTAELVVIFTLCTKIRRLELATHDYGNTMGGHDYDTDCNVCPDLMACLLAIHTSSMLDWSLSKLTYANLFGRQNLRCHTGTSHAGISSIFCAPALETLTCSGFGSIASTYPWVCPLGASNVQSLMLVLGNLKTPDAVQILDSCRALRNCDIRWCCFDTPDGNFLLEDYEVDTHSLLAALSHHSKTLERLVLTNNDERGRAFTGHAHVGTLRHFGKLRKLKVDQRFFIGDSTWAPDTLQDKLPPALTKLVINTSDPNFLTLGEILTAVSAYDGTDLNDLRVTFIVDSEEELDARLQSMIVGEDDIPAWELGKDRYEDGTRTVFRCGCDGPLMGPLVSLMASTASAEAGIEMLLRLQERSRAVSNGSGDEDGESESEGGKDEEEDSEVDEQEEDNVAGVDAHTDAMAV